MSDKLITGITVLGLGIMAGLNLYLQARNNPLEEIIETISLSHSYPFDVLPVNLEDYLAISVQKDLQSLLIVSDSRSASGAALEGWRLLLKRLDQSTQVEVVLVGVDNDEFHELVAEVRSQGLPHQSAIIEDTRAFAGRTGLYAPITAVVGGTGRIGLMCAAPLGEAEVTAFDDLIEGRRTWKAGRPFLRRKRD